MIDSNIGVGIGSSPSPRADLATTSRGLGGLVFTAIRDQWLFTAILLIGFGIRAALIPSVASHIDADEASIWLQAVHMTKGEFSPFFWGTNYGGTLAQLVLAGLIKLVGAHLVLIRLTNLLYSTVGAVILRDAVRRTFGRNAADGAFGLYWLFPAFTYWYGTREYGHYYFSIALAILTVWVAIRLHERPNLLRALALGLLVGLCFWSFQLLAVIMMLPAVAVLISPVVRWSQRVIAVLAAPVGAAPWILYNHLNGWQSLNPIPAYPVVLVAPPNPRLLVRLLEAVVVVYPAGYTAGPGPAFTPTLAIIIGFATFGVVGVAALVFILRRDVPRLVLAGSVLVWPALIAFFHLYSSLETFRYDTYLYPVLFPLVTSGIKARWLAAVVAALAILICIGVVYRWSGGFLPSGTYAHASEVDAVAHVLEASGRTRVYADYWVAYPLSAQSAEAVIADPIAPSYYAGYHKIVAATSPTTFVLFAGQSNDLMLEQRLATPGTPAATRHKVGDYVIYSFGVRVDPAALGLR